MRFPNSPSILLSAALCSALLAACSHSDSEKNSDAPRMNPTSGEVLKGKTPAQDDAILATVDGVAITVSEFQSRINRQSPYIRARYTSTKQKKEFLSNLIRFEVLAQEAQNEGFAHNIDVVRAMKQSMVQKLMTQRLENGIQPSDVKEADMRAYFDAHTGEFNKPEERRATAIILGDQATAETLAKRARGSEGGSNRDFRELVVLNTTDKESKKLGGDLQYLTKESPEVPREVTNAIFALAKTGDVAGPIKTSSGKFYIVKQTGRRKAISKSFDDVKRQIQNRLYRDLRTRAQADFVEKLRSKANIEIFENKLSQVQIDKPQEDTPLARGPRFPHMPSQNPSQNSPHKSSAAPHVTPPHVTSETP